MTNSTLLRVLRHHLGRIAHAAPLLMLGFVLQLQSLGLAVWLLIAMVSTSVARSSLRAAVALCLSVVGASMMVWMVEWAGRMVVPSGVRRGIFGAVLLAMLLVIRLNVDWAASGMKTERWGLVSTTVLLAWVASWSPHGPSQSLGFLYAEDNEQWLRPLISSERGELQSVVVSTSTRNMQFTFRLLLDLVAGLNPTGEPSMAAAGRGLIALSNALLLALAMMLLLVPLAVDALWRILSSDGSGSSGCAISSVVSQVACVFTFGQFQSVGHIPAFIASVLGLCAAVVSLGADRSRAASRRTFTVLLVVVAAVGLVGTYNPWAPISILLLLAVTLSRIGLTVLGALRRSWFLIVLSVLAGSLAAIQLARTFFEKLGDLDESASTATAHAEALWVMLGSVMILVAVVNRCGRGSKNGESDVRRSVKEIDGGLGRLVGIASVLASLALVSTQLLGSDESQKVALAAVVLALVPLAAYALQTSSAEFRWQSGAPWTFITYFAGSILYTGLIWILSRYIGPPFEPRYAARKSLLIVLAQFGWVVVALTVHLVSRFPRSIAVTFLPGALVSLGLIFGFQSYFNVKYVQSQWWHGPVLRALAERPDELIVCAVPTYGLPDYETYTCNRFLQTLGQSNDIPYDFRYAAWYNNEAPLRGLKLLTERNVKKLTVISRSELGQEWRDQFASIPRLNLRNIVAQSTQ